MAELRFKPTTLSLDIWSSFKLYFWLHKSKQHLTDLTDPLQLSVWSAQTLRKSAIAHARLSSLSHDKISASYKHGITMHAQNM